MIEMILTRPARIHGREQGAGDLVSVDAHTAARLLETSRARLVDAADLVVVLHHVERQRGAHSEFGARAVLTRGPLQTPAGPNSSNRKS